MNNKKLLQIVIICVVAIWVFCITFTVGVIRVRKQNQAAASPSALSTSNSYTQGQSTQPTDFSETQQNPTVSESAQTTEPTFGSTEPTSDQNSDPQSKIPTSRSEIIAAYVDAVNRLKSEQNFSLTKTELLSVSISKMTPDSAKSIANKMIESNRKTKPDVYNFVNGFDAASGMSPNSVIAPLGTYAALNDSVVTKAESTPNLDGSFTVSISLGQETQTLDSAAPNYSTSMQVIRLEELGLPSNARFDSLTILYDNSTIEALIGSDGRILSMRHYLNVSHAEGSGSMVFPITAELNGDFTTTYKINY